MIKAVIADEFRQLPRRLGGIRGALLLAGMIVLGALPVFRFGLSFLDPLVLMAYTCFAVLFASAFVVRAFTEGTQANFVSDRDWVYGKVLASTLYGWLAFAVILGVALLVLGRAPSPPALLSVVVLAACLAWMVSGLGALASLGVENPASARQLLRLGFFFILLVILAGSRFAPPAWRDAGAGLFVRGAFVRTTLMLCALCLVVGVLSARKAMHILADRRTGLSIL